MSITVKKIIAFIPFVNILVVPFLWFRFYFKNPIPKVEFIKCVFKCFLFCIIITIPRIIIYKIFGNGLLDTIVTYIGIILTMFVICFIMVRNEEKIKNSCEFR